MLLVSVKHNMLLSLLVFSFAIWVLSCSGHCRPEAQFHSPSPPPSLLHFRLPSRSFCCCYLLDKMFRQVTDSKHVPFLQIPSVAPSQFTDLKIIFRSSPRSVRVALNHWTS
uniref:Secreted protein n=1 Tax=Stegastes partitus TaxID=144197 RepID=A0A3B4ZT03_9TELE